LIPMTATVLVLPITLRSPSVLSSAQGITKSVTVQGGVKNFELDIYRSHLSGPTRLRVGPERCERWLKILFSDSGLVFPVFSPGTTKAYEHFRARRPEKVYPTQNPSHPSGRLPESRKEERGEGREREESYFTVCIALVFGVCWGYERGNLFIVRRRDERLRQDQHAWGL
jgi:hypothetical protein